MFGYNDWLQKAIDKDNQICKGHDVFLLPVAIKGDCKYAVTDGEWKMIKRGTRVRIKDLREDVFGFEYGYIQYDTILNDTKDTFTTIVVFSHHIIMPLLRDLQDDKQAQIEFEFWKDYFNNKQEETK